MSDEYCKVTSGKLRVDLVPIRPMVSAVALLREWSVEVQKKYPDPSSPLRVSSSDLCDALVRHALDLHEGGAFARDPEHSLPHLCGVLFNAAFLVKRIGGLEDPHAGLILPWCGASFEDRLK